MADKSPFEAKTPMSNKDIIDLKRSTENSERRECLNGKNWEDDKPDKWLNQPNDELNLNIMAGEAKFAY